jgi:hypothetical protein
MLLFVKEINTTNKGIEVVFNNGILLEGMKSYIHTFEDERVTDILPVGTRVSWLPITHCKVSCWLYVTSNKYILSKQIQLGNFLQKAIELGMAELTSG